MKKSNPALARSQHAVNQERYFKKKLLTHRHVAVWVPNNRIDEFRASIKRMKRKWGRA